jgi:hypothetical protein
VQNERAYYWSYFEGADLSDAPTFVFHRWGDRFIIANPSDHGLYMVGVSPERDEGRDFRRNLESHFMDHALSCEPVAGVLNGARRATKIFGIVRFDGYFREPCGPGWVLVGDSGHFKDPAAGRGIGDAFLQVDALAPAIVAGLGDSRHALDRRLARFGSWRDREFAEHYWLGVDFGTAGAIPTVAPELIRRLIAQGKSDRFVELLSHRTRPSQVLTPTRTVAAAGRLLRRRGTRRRALLREVGALAAKEARRRWVNRVPSFAARAVPGAADPGHAGQAEQRVVELAANPPITGA